MLIRTLRPFILIEKGGEQWPTSQKSFRKMAKSVFCFTVLVVWCFVSLVAWADDRVFLTEENERRWNTPPELIPEQFMKMFNKDTRTGRFLAIPITTNVNINAVNNAHSLDFQVEPGSYSESNSFNRPLLQSNGGISQSQSLSFAAEPMGIATSISEASQNYPVFGSGENANSQVNDHNFGRPAVSLGNTQSGYTTAVAFSTSTSAISAGPAHSSASSSATNTGFSQGMSIRFPGPSTGKPIWNNIRPNHNNNNNNNNNGHHAPRRPKLDIEVKPYHEQDRRPIMLHVSTQQPKLDNRQPKIHIHKWRPNYSNNPDDKET